MADSGTADASPPPASAAYLAYLADDQTVYRGRLEECLNVEPQSFWPSEAEQPTSAASIDRGFTRFDAAVASACVAALRTASCDAILRRFSEEHTRWPRPAICPGALTPQAKLDGACLLPEDCQSPDETNCVTTTDRCSRACRVERRSFAGVGQSCLLGGCRPGLVCLSLSEGADPVCQEARREGQRCNANDQCADGLFCAAKASGVRDGTCRRIAFGGRCLGRWQCPVGLDCVVTTADARGSCQPGKRLGEACAVLGMTSDGVPYSSCANSLCLDLDGHGLRCARGSALGQPCGNFSTGSGYAWCLEGYCEAIVGEQRAECRPLKAAGAVCRLGGLECEPSAVCTGPRGQAPTCTPLDQVKAGDDCKPGPGRPPQCPSGMECRQDHPYSYKASCQPVKKVGESCQLNLDHCETGTTCKQGVCTGC